MLETFFGKSKIKERYRDPKLQLYSGKWYRIKSRDLIVQAFSDDLINQSQFIFYYIVKSAEGPYMNSCEVTVDDVEELKEEDYPEYYI